MLLHIFIASKISMEKQKIISPYINRHQAINGEICSAQAKEPIQSRKTDKRRLSKHNYIEAGAKQVYIKQNFSAKS